MARGPQGSRCSKRRVSDVQPPCVTIPEPAEVPKRKRLRELRRPTPHRARERRKAIAPPQRPTRSHARTRRAGEFGLGEMSKLTPGQKSDRRCTIRGAFSTARGSIAQLATSLPLMRCPADNRTDGLV